MAAKLTVLPNGSLKVEGAFELLDAAGKAYTLQEAKPVFLCRCGQTKNTPFCDGSHKECNFSSPSEAR